LLKNGEISQPNTNTQIVGFGSSVKVKTKLTKEPLIFMLVSTHEADPLNGKLSVESPIGLALLNKKVGDVVTVTTPKGELNYTLMEII
jgi:transcription elongation GreA/GreB family factor